MDYFIFPLGGTGHPPTTIYRFLSKQKETVFTKKLHPNCKWVWKTSLSSLLVEHSVK